MSETYRAKLLRTNQEILIQDDEPLYSAKLFKYVSDQTWMRRPYKRHRTGVYNFTSVIPFDEAHALTRETVAGIDERLLVANTDINFGKYYGEGDDIIVPAGSLTMPADAWIETFNWDLNQTGRSVEIDGETHYVKFTDKHYDYAREMAIKFRFDIDGGTAVEKYVMQRYQYYQGENTDLIAKASHNLFAEMGYDGKEIYSLELTEEQEIKILSVIARMGGIALDRF